jgi:hypothetical protein
MANIVQLKSANFRGAEKTATLFGPSLPRVLFVMDPIGPRDDERAAAKN